MVLFFFFAKKYGQRVIYAASLIPLLHHESVHSELENEKFCGKNLRILKMAGSLNP